MSFPLPSRKLTVAIIIAGLCCVAPLQSEDLPALKRLTPVPADQQIPAADFLRPALLREPKLSPSGTHVAAIVTAGEDNHLLLVYDLASQKYDLLGQQGDLDVNDVFWLNDKRLVYQVSTQKLYGIGLFAADVGDLANTYPILQYWGTSLIAIPRSDRLSPLVWNSIDQLRPPWQDLGAATVSSAMASKAKGVNLLTGMISASEIQPVIENNDLHILDRYPVPGGGSTLSYIADKDGKLAFALEASMDGVLAERSRRWRSVLQTLLMPELWIAAQVRKRAMTMAWTPGLVMDYARALRVIVHPVPRPWFQRIPWRGQSTKALPDKKQD